MFLNQSLYDLCVVSNKINLTTISYRLIVEILFSLCTVIKTRPAYADITQPIRYNTLFSRFYIFPADFLGNVTIAQLGPPFLTRC